ncbi:MAG TPA: hypothetical protein VG604_00555 [Candidatus Saccharimonadales bacterium]|nr:hypothetical protein [Candidatus Saccharimonadales bacterium]
MLSTQTEFFELVTDKETWREPGSEGDKIDNLWLGHGEQARTALHAERDEDIVWYAKGEISREIDDPKMTPIYADAKADLMDIYNLTEAEFADVVWRAHARLRKGEEWDLKADDEEFFNIVHPLRHNINTAAVSAEEAQKDELFQRLVKVLKDGAMVKPQLRRKVEQKLALRYWTSPMNIQKLVKLQLQEHEIMDTDGET